MSKGDQEFHWTEGMKYAVEGIKSLFLLNGAASLAVMSFVGHTDIVTQNLVHAMGLFTIGALVASISYLFAYLTQLEYGNGNTSLAWTYHKLTYLVIGGSVFLFISGVFFAMTGFSSNLAH